MSKGPSIRALAILCAGAIALSAGAAWAQPDRYSRTQAECDRIKAEFQKANSTAQGYGRRDGSARRRRQGR